MVCPIWGFRHLNPTQSDGVGLVTKPTSDSSRRHHLTWPPKQACDERLAQLVLEPHGPPPELGAAAASSETLRPHRGHPVCLRGLV